MELFLDTANIEEIKEILPLGVIRGLTTNPKIMSNEKGANFEKHMKELLKMIDGPVSIEVTSNELNEMVSQAEKFSTWGKNVVVKIPMGMEGLKAVSILSKKGIKTNVTACMASNQVMMAAMAGATYASIFFCRVGDMGYYAEEVVRDAVDIIERSGLNTKVIVGSIRNIMDINRSIAAGAHVITVPYKFFKQLATNPKTDETINEFLKSWEEFKKTEGK